MKWNQNKINELWVGSKNIYNKYNIQIDPRLLMSIIIQEGTGSFNTSSTNRAADGQHGVEKDFAVDFMKANDLIFGKILGYAYYGEDFNDAVKISNQNAGISGKGDFFQYANWKTPIVKLKYDRVELGNYAGHGRWNERVKSIYEEFTAEGYSNKYSNYLINIDKAIVESILGDIYFPFYNFIIRKNEQNHRGEYNGEYTIIGEIK